MFLQEQPAPRAEKNSTSARAQRLLEEIGTSDEPLPLAWNKAFKGRRVAPAVLTVAFTWLHRQKHYDEAVEGIQAAIRNDHAQPWMYDVLAIEMKLAKRPQKEIDRALLSRIDFAAGDEAQMLVTASTLAGFDAFDEALRLCREAAKRNPWEPRVWAAAREIATRSGAPEAIIWAQAGTIKHVWKGDYESRHAEGRAILSDLMTQLTTDGKPELADRARAAVQEADQRDLRMRISWAGNADLDLSVIEPDGQVCSRKSPLTTNGGILVKESNGKDANSQNGRPSEEYVCVEAPSGEYTLKIRYIVDRVLLGKVRVDLIRYENSEREQKQTQTFDSVVDQDLVVKVVLNNGRGVKNLR